jgi:hypothetical protein
MTQPVTPKTRLPFRVDEVNEDEGWAVISARFRLVFDVREYLDMLKKYGKPTSRYIAYENGAYIFEVQGGGVAVEVRGVVHAGGGKNA